MLLLVDIGNTRIKWATWRDGKLSPQHAAVYANWSAADIGAHLLSSCEHIDRVIIANVGGPKIALHLREAVEQHCRVQPQFVVSSRECCGVRNAYQEPEKLGVDRWLSLIAARALSSSRVCVVSVGTAMTIDAIDEAGSHLGGLIVPGPALMVRSLMHNTSDIAQRAQGGRADRSLFADNTLGAVHQGSLHAAAALIDHSVRTLQAKWASPPTLIVTGGASAEVMPLVQVPALDIPDLVLRGLAIWAQHHP